MLGQIFESLLHSLRDLIVESGMIGLQIDKTAFVYCSWYINKVFLELKRYFISNWESEHIWYFIETESNCNHHLFQL